MAGYDVLEQPQKVRASIGFLSSTTALYGRQTGLEVLGYFGELYGLSGLKLKERIDFVVGNITFQELRPAVRQDVDGPEAAISIARAILHDPPVLFFDEPTAGLDVVTSQTIMEFIEGTRKEGKTVVFCTHIMSEAERLCDELAVIHQGSHLRTRLRRGA